MLRVIVSTLALLSFCVAGYCLALSFGDGHETFSSDKLLYLRVAGILLVGVGAYLILVLPSKKEVVHFVDTQPFTPQVITAVNPSTRQVSQYMHSAPGVLIGITPNTPPAAYGGTHTQSPWMIPVAEVAEFPQRATFPADVVDNGCTDEVSEVGGRQAAEAVCQVIETVVVTEIAQPTFDSAPAPTYEAPSSAAQTDF